MELQTPEQLQFLSLVGHTIEGILLATVGVIALMEGLGYLKSQWTKYLWPALIVVAGVFLPVYIVLQRGVDQIGASLNFVTHDPQQRQHVFMAFLLVIAGIAELLVRSRKVQAKLWKFIPPAALLAIGITLLFHAQYGTPEAVAEAMRKHHYQGVTVILVALFRAAELIRQRTQKWLAYPWIIFLFIAATLLITYREPWGAYRNPDGSLVDVMRRSN
jgi:hypothetical protein